MLLGIVIMLAAAGAAIICGCTGSFQSLSWLWVLPVSFLGGFLLLVLLVFLFLLAVIQPIDRSKPQEEDSKFYRFILNMMSDTAVPVMRVRMHLKGLEKTPTDGRFLLACNHLSLMDPVLLVNYFRKSQLAFISKRENGTMFMVGKLMHKVLCQPINRENDREALKTIIRCIQILKEDKASIAVFPEGYTSLDGKLHPFRSGVFKIAQKAKVPIVVCTLRNTQHIFHNAARLRHTDVDLHLLEVIPASELEGVTAVDIGKRVHALMAADLGPENVLKTAEQA